MQLSTVLYQLAQKHDPFNKATQWLVAKATNHTPGYVEALAHQHGDLLRMVVELRDRIASLQMEAGKRETPPVQDDFTKDDLLLLRAYRQLADETVGKGNNWGKNKGDGD
jgi:hypothetical protein